MTTKNPATKATAKIGALPKHSPLLELDVDEATIAAAERRSSSHCMIAEAVKSAAHARGFEPRHVSVDLQTIRFTDQKRMVRYTYLTPRRGQVALVSFDQGIHTDPFKLTLRGGQVTRANAKKLRKAAAGDPKKGHLTKPSSKTQGVIPTKVGGQTPPLASVRGVRREFGLRGLVR